jgi:hypothetical protein
MHVYVCVYIHTYIHTYIQIYKCTYNIYTHTHTHTHTVNDSSEVGVEERRPENSPTRLVRDHCTHYCTVAVCEPPQLV